MFYRAASDSSVSEYSYVSGDIKGKNQDFDNNTKIKSSKKDHPLIFYFLEKGVSDSSDVTGIPCRTRVIIL